MAKAKNGGVGTPRIPTAAEIFEDGLVLDLIRNPSYPNRINLISWNGKSLETVSEFPRAGRIYRPVDIDGSISQALRLPTRVAPPAPARKLFETAFRLLREQLGQFTPCTKKLVFAIFASWLSPVLPMAPITFIFVAEGSPKNNLLQLLSAMCRRPLLLVGATRADLRFLPFSLRPTILLDEPSLRPEMEAILLSGTRRGSHIRNGHSIVDPFGPKIICSRDLKHGTALETEAFRITLNPASGVLPPLDLPTLEKIADKLQAQFFGYYLRNCSRVKIPDFDVSHLTVPMQDLARALGAAVIDEELQAEIPQLLGDQDEEIRAGHSQAFDAVTLEGMLFFAHDNECTKVRAAQAAEQISAIYRGRGDDRQISPEAVGWALKRLGVPGGRLNRAGNGVELTPSTRQVIHRLASSFGVRAFPVGFRDGCKYCAELKQEAARANIRVAAS